MPSVLQISDAVSLALHSMALIAQSSQKAGELHGARGSKAGEADVDLVSVKDIVGITGFSQAHLSKILQRLVKAGLLESTRGPRGGFAITRDPGRITLLEIYEAIEGPLAPEHCIARVDVCPFDKCILADIPERLTRDFIQYLAGTTLADVCK